MVFKYNANEMKEIQSNLRVLGIDWGGKRIGIAISDETGTLARSLSVIDHVSRKQDAIRISTLAKEQGVSKIIIGVTYEDDGSLTPSGRSAERLARAVEDESKLPTILFDETGSTLQARSDQIKAETTRKSRKGHLDAKAAAVILQTFLNEAKNNE